jgi:hypothetical protein
MTVLGTKEVTIMTTPRNYLLVSGTIFGLVALLQFGRAIVGLPVMIDAWLVPRAASLLLGGGAAAMSVWAFVLRQRMGRR